MTVVWKRILLRTILFLFLCISLHNKGWSQFDQGGGGGGIGTDPGDPGIEDDPPEDGFPDPDLPIDSSILVLVIAVVGYGLKKVWDVKQDLKRKKSLQATTANYEDFVK